MNRFLILVLLLLPFSALAQLAIPEHGGVWVHDEAHVLSAGARSELEGMLKAERDSTTNQIAVLIVPSLEGEALEDYTLRVAEKWKLGKKDTDNGILFFIAIKDRKIRLEVGLGQEGALTDAMASRIDRNEVAPHFRQGDYDGGVKAGVIAIIQVIKGQYKNNDPIPTTAYGKRRTRSPWLSLIVIIIIVIAASRRRGGGGGAGGYFAAGSILGSGMGGGGSWGGGDYGGGGSFGGGGSSDSW